MQRGVAIPKVQRRRDEGDAGEMELDMEFGYGGGAAATAASTTTASTGFTNTTNKNNFVSGDVPPPMIVSQTPRSTPTIIAAEEKDSKVALIWALLASYLPDDQNNLQKEFVRHVEYTLAQTRTNLDNIGAFQALAHSTRDRLIERWKDTQLYFQQQDVKQVNYLSLEFLIGRSLQNALISLGLEGKYSQALMQLGFKLEDLYDEEKDAGLGNGGLGRLAACFMDSLATMDYPAWGYGLRYTYGMFYQKILEGRQIELPDYWLNFGNPWEIERLDVKYTVRFYGHVREVIGPNGRPKIIWEGGDVVYAVAYDYPIPGYNTYNTINIRLWSSKPSTEMNLERFNQGDYFGAIEDKQKSENITNVLYPNDNTSSGKELRLKQQYLFVSATLQDIMARFRRTGHPLSDFPTKMAVQLNDTHPTLGIPELLRLLIDDEGLDWDSAWDITTRTFSYTNHTVLPEALERWSVGLMEHLLPRLMRIIYDINLRHLQFIEKLFPGDIDKLRSMSIIDENPPRSVRMANLAIVGSHVVNGVAYLHSELLKTDVFADFFKVWPKKFQNKTNGVTPRRWLHQSNPALSRLITQWLKTETWLTHLDLLSGLRAFAENGEFQRQWMAVKHQNKERLARYIAKKCGVQVDSNALFDVQVKRFHEYKRQLLNIFGVIYRYKQIKSASVAERSKIVPRVIIFGGKAAPGYFMAKLVIQLVTAVGNVVNNDRDVGDLLKVVFLPNYCVSAAEIIVPASDISQHISTAGTEASGTSNMKFTMSGGLILGTLDGANIEIREEIGDDNMFIFGAITEEVSAIRDAQRKGTLKVDPRFQEVVSMVASGMFPCAESFQPIVNSVTGTSDFYILGYDFPSYLEAQKKIDEAYRDKVTWAKMSILAAAGTGKFSADRTIKQYAEDIWNIQTCRRMGPVPVSIERLTTQGLVPPDISPVGSPTDVSVSIERLSPHIHAKIGSSLGRSPGNTTTSFGWRANPTTSATQHSTSTSTGYFFAQKK